MSVESLAINEPKKKFRGNSLFPVVEVACPTRRFRSSSQLRRGVDSAKSVAEANMLQLGFQRSPRDSTKIV